MKSQKTQKSQNYFEKKKNKTGNITFQNSRNILQTV